MLYSYSKTFKNSDSNKYYKSYSKFYQLSYVGNTIANETICNASFQLTTDG